MLTDCRRRIHAAAGSPARNSPATGRGCAGFAKVLKNRKLRAAYGDLRQKDKLTRPPQRIRSRQRRMPTICA